MISCRPVDSQSLSTSERIRRYLFIVYRPVYIKNLNYILLDKTAYTEYRKVCIKNNTCSNFDTEIEHGIP